MAPKVIDHPDFKFREEIPNEVIGKLVINGGAEKVKQTLINFGSMSAMTMWQFLF